MGFTIPGIGIVKEVGWFFEAYGIGCIKHTGRIFIYNQ